MGTISIFRDIIRLWIDADYVRPTIIKRDNLAVVFTPGGSTIRPILAKADPMTLALAVHQDTLIIQLK